MYKYRNFCLYVFFILFNLYSIKMTSSSTICFFGASVTAQKTGYAYVFKQLLADDNYDVHVFGYGSMHLCDAGVCFLDAVIEKKPNYCFIDWFSTGFMCSETNYLYAHLDAIVLNLHNIRAVPVFLLFDRCPGLCEKRRSMYSVVHAYCTKHNIYCINLYDNDNVDKLLRDEVHTTDIGSAFYGKAIYDHFIQSVAGKRTFCDLQHFDLEKVQATNKYLSIHTISLQKDIYEKLVLKGRDCHVLGMYQTIGPFSPLVEIEHSETGEKERIVVWDQWCHYERPNFKLPFKVHGTTVISVLPDEFSRESCKVQREWTDTKHLKIISIHYTGAGLIVDEDESY